MRDASRPAMVAVLPTGSCPSSRSTVMGVASQDCCIGGRDSGTAGAWGAERVGGWGGGGGRRESRGKKTVAILNIV